MRLFLSLILTTLLGIPSFAADFKAGTASKVITPTEPLWMAGYANRNKPCDTTRHDLWVKALALEDPAGNRFVLLTSDLCGIPRAVSEPVCADVMKGTGLKREQLLLTCSHTHCGPVVQGNLTDMYDMPPDQPDKIGAYTEKLRGAMVETMLAAVNDLKSAKLSIGEGTAGFAVNRRQVTDKGVINGRNPEGPVDHTVPVLKVEDEAGKLKAVVFGYACHNTTMQFYEWCGDYAGFAQIELEKKHPGALALFWIGCGADANPLPRSKIELCQQYGKELAGAVEDTIAKRMSPLTDKVTARYAEIDLPFDTIPGKDKWAADTLSKNHATATRAKRMLDLLESGKPIPTSYPRYPVEVWRFGDQLTWVALGGEVVVDYNRRLKKELGGKSKSPVWVTGYANDVMAYIPSERVLKEGGYEGDTSQVPYGMPAKWGAGIEDKIVGKVLELVK
ncbi:MAG: neutral/alkaline non-lysosomal ceramidase N-terminal domain-containing protein [Zavarzinella sp.]|nr:neutral/alkaline non-lysosomal ceramidase N-terminal domain-containing protein [Zavarzinella sp.]